MKKIQFNKVICFVLMCAVLSVAFASINTNNYVYAADASMRIDAKSAVLMDVLSGKVLFEQNPHDKMPPASITKVMTLLLIYEAQQSGKFAWDDLVTISEYASSMGGSQVFLEPMETQTAKELTKCIAIASANDAAVAMAEFVGGSEEAFVGMMNEKAKALGMNDTSFKNACGLDDEGHVTSAYDIALVSRELMIKYPEITEYTKTWQDTITHKTKRGETEFGLTNTNKLLKMYQGATGLKTGSTSKALYCLSGTASKNGFDLIGVVLGAPDYKTRFKEVVKLLDYGYANYSVVEGEAKDTKMGEITVYKGETETVNAVVAKDVKLVTKKGVNVELQNKVELIDSVKAPVIRGTKVGEVVYFVDGSEVGRCDLITETDVNKAGISNMIKKVLDGWFQ